MMKLIRREALFRWTLFSSACFLFIVILSPSLWAQDGSGEEPIEPTEVESQAADEEVEKSDDYDEDEFFDLVAQAQKHFEAEEYEEAVEYFKEAHAMRAESTLLFNIGFSLEKLGRLHEALEFYDEFVSAPNVSLKARRYAHKRSNILREIIADEEEEQQAVEGEAEKEAEETARAEQQNEADSSQQEANKPPPPNYDYTMSWVTLGAGSVLAAGGGVFMALAHASGDAVNEGLTPDERRASKGDAETYAVVSDSLFVAGGLLAVSSVYFWLTADPIEQAAPVTIAPQITPQRAGVQVHMRF